MDFHDPDRPTVDDGPTIVRDDPVRPMSVGWVLVGIGLVGYLAIQIWQAVTFGFGQVATNLLMGIGFFVTTSLTTAGIIVLVLRRWVLPELIAAVAPPQPAVPAEGDPVLHDDD